MRFLSLLSLVLVTTVAARAEYGIVTRFHVGGDASRWDYLRLDPETRYVYVAHFTHFEVLNADTGAKVGEIGPASRAHGVAIVPELHRGFATSGSDNAVIVFDTRTLKTIQVLKTGGTNPDAVQYDATDTKRIYVVNGSSGTVAVIDPDAVKVVGLVTLTEGKLEQIGFDGRGRAFVNNEEKSQMHVFDTHTLKPIANWSLAPGEGGTGLMVDAAHHRVFATCGNNLLVVLDSDSGKVVATPKIGADPDGGVYDADRALVFTSNADGTMTVLHQDSPDTYSLVQTVQTGTGAKQIALDEKTGHVFLPTGEFQKSTAKLPPVVAGTMDILVVGEK